MSARVLQVFGSLIVALAVLAFGVFVLGYAVTGFGQAEGLALLLTAAAACGVPLVFGCLFIAAAHGLEALDALVEESRKQTVALDYMAKVAQWQVKRAENGAN